MREITSFYVNKDRSIDIYIGKNMREEVITIPEETITKINVALSKLPMSDILEEQKEHEDAILSEMDPQLKPMDHPNWGPEMHPDYPKN